MLITFALSFVLLHVKRYPVPIIPSLPVIKCSSVKQLFLFLLMTFKDHCLQDIFQVPFLHWDKKCDI